jgi:T4 bacteriophage base plate protein
MPFKLNAYLPSKQCEVRIKELYYKQYRDLVKSLYNTNKKETIQQYNSILEDLCSDAVDNETTFEDKLSLLLTIRNYCVSPDLKLKCVLANGETFNSNIDLEKIIKLVNNINKSSIVVLNDITIKFSSYKIRDEWVFSGNNKDTISILSSWVDSIEINNQLILFKDLYYEERFKIIEALPVELVRLLNREVKKIEDKFESVELLTVKNPITQNTILSLSCNITFEVLQKMVEFLFAENLNNVYRAFYNMVNYGGFTAEYVDSITPIELQVYWMYYMQDRQKKEETKAPSVPVGSLQTTHNNELGF